MLSFILFQIPDTSKVLKFYCSGLRAEMEIETVQRIFSRFGRNIGNTMIRITVSMNTILSFQLLTLSLTGGGLGGPPLAELAIAPKRIYILI